ncbi:hypothetical protein [Staphylococcus simulans]|uniref:hypothetical protein n=1 Tax=Staphylococcus simulans TaxID=1286 RepID=UPI002DB8B7E2|nr:hypothetical protein [Staphylococcus simulans]MEB6838015.1 hypothetical protein [Staphylococcus simulans]
MKAVLPDFINDIKELRNPYSLFLGQKVVVTLLDGTEYNGVFLKYSPYEIYIETNIGTQENPEKGVMMIHKKDYISIEENHKGNRQKRMQPYHRKKRKN